MKFSETPTEEISHVGTGTFKKLCLPPIQDHQFPTVSIVTPLLGGSRADFIPLMINNFKNIDYPTHLLEWVIVDDEPNTQYVSLFESLGPKVRYLKYTKEQLSIGKKRNFLAAISRHDYIVHMDDDDYYPSCSVAARIRVLLEHEKRSGKAGCVGCHTVDCYNLINDQTFEAFDPDDDGNPYTISESTMAYSKKYWETQPFDNDCRMTECLALIKDRESSVCTMPSSFVITQFTHTTNTVSRSVKEECSNRKFLLKNNSFLNRIPISDKLLVEKLRATLIIKQFPSWKEASEFVQLAASSEPGRIRKELKKLEEQRKYELLKNPMIINLYRHAFYQPEKRNPKKINYYCGPGNNFKFSNPWNTNSLILGGSEEAIIGLTTEFAKMGYKVTVYCVLEGNETEYNGVRYRHYWKWIPGNHAKATIVWRDPSNAELEINSDKVLLDLHDAIDPVWLKVIPPNVLCLVKSQYHAKILDLCPSNYEVIPNGINSSPPKTNHVPFSLVCTSSPDRCLEALLRATPIIRKEVPQATVYWAYGFKAGVTKGGMEADSRKEVKDWVSDMKKRIKHTKGFVDLGRLSQKEVADLYNKADLFVYGTEFPEIDCISLTKAMDAGAIPIVTPSGAMAEKIPYVLLPNGEEPENCAKSNQSLINSSLGEGELFDKWVSDIIRMLKNVNRDKLRNTISKGTAFYHWNKIASRWMSVI